ncbi:MAG TPA: LysR family transcriptional regulator [Casimicrobiaceae bacterium]
MNSIASLDLNLLVAFDAIVKERNITLAAQRIGLSQPAMSSALGRLRKTFNDQLFVRTGSGMQPTPYAQLLAPPIQRACELIATSLQIGAEFEPATSTRAFSFYMTDIGEAVYLPRLLSALAERAPRTRVQVLRIPERGAQEAMAAGEVDIAIGLFPSLKAGFFQQRLYRDEFVCVLRADHPQVGGELTLKQFAALRHAVIATAGTGHEITVERAFGEQRLRRRVALTIPHFMAVPVIVAHTDVVATVPRRLALAFAGYPNVRLLEPPIPIPQFEIKQHWHRRYHHDPANKWLRRLLADLFLE